MVERQTTEMSGILPPQAVKLVSAWLETLVHGPHVKFGIGFIVSLIFAFWSGWSAIGMLIAAVNTCYDEEDKRSFTRFNLIALGLTAGLVPFGILAVSVVTLLPAALDLLALPKAFHGAITQVRWPALAGTVMLGLAALYRYAPDRKQPKKQSVSLGAAVATALWIVSSIVFTFFISLIGGYDKMYGSLSAVIILLLSLYLAAYAVLVGAEINAEIDRERDLREDSRAQKAR